MKYFLPLVERISIFLIIDIISLNVIYTNALMSAQQSWKARCAPFYKWRRVIFHWYERMFHLPNARYIKASMQFVQLRTPLHLANIPDAQKIISTSAWTEQIESARLRDFIRISREIVGNTRDIVANIPQIFRTF